MPRERDAGRRTGDSRGAGGLRSHGAAPRAAGAATRVAAWCVAAIASAEAPSVGADDLDTLVQAIERTHPGWRERVGEDAWRAAVAAARVRLVDASSARTYLELARLVALLGDGHSMLLPRGDVARAHAIALDILADGLWVVAAAPAYERLVGARVVAVGGVAIDAVFARLRPFASGDSEHGASAAVARLLTMPAVLHELGLADADATRVEVAHGDRREAVTLPHGASVAMPVARDGWITAPALAQSTTPLLRHPERAFWFESLPGGIVWARMRAVADAPTESIADFATALYAAAADPDVDKLVLDLRGNGGGDNYLNQPIVHGAIRCRLDTPGHLFVVTDAHTFSAGVNLAGELERETHALFVGEPSGAGPNHYGDASSVTLPHSGHVLRLSTVRWQGSDPRDTRRAIQPDLAAPCSMAALREDRDPALAAIRAFRAQNAALPASPRQNWARSSQRR